MAASVVIATTTFYRSITELRFKLACDMVRKARAMGYEVVVVDDSPEGSVLTTLRDLGARVYVQAEKGMANGRREVFGRAAMIDPDVIFWTEPEKVDIVQWVEDIIEPILSGERDIVIPTRSAASLSTYPKFQVEEEALANTVYRNATGIDADPMMGPVAFSFAVARDFYDCDPAAYGVQVDYLQHAAPLIAASKGARVGTVEVDFHYPAEQKAEEDKGGPLFEQMVEKRLGQGKQLVNMYFSLAQQLRLGPYRYASTQEVSALNECAQREEQAKDEEE